MGQKYEKTPKTENDTLSTYNYKKNYIKGHFDTIVQTLFSTRNIQMTTV